MIGTPIQFVSQNLLANSNWLGTFSADDWTDQEVSDLLDDFKLFLDALEPKVTYVVTDNGEGDIEITFANEWESFDSTSTRRLYQRKRDSFVL